MISSRAMGLVLPNQHDQNVPELVSQRTIGSMPFAGRYRMIDFCLSGMANAGIQNIGVIARKNYQSLMDHLGNGGEWDLSRKLGGLIIFPPFARDGGEMYHGRVEALASVMTYLENQKEDLVVMSDCDIAFNLNYKDLLAKHRDSGADVTVVYEKADISEGMIKDNVTLTLDDKGIVRELRVNEYKKGSQNLCMNVYVVGRGHLISMVREAMVRGNKSFEQEVLAKSIKHMKVRGYKFTGYSGRIYDMPSYFRESLRLLDTTNLARLFPEEMPVHTKVRDEAPVRYAIGAKVTNSLVADGCIIEGEVEGCVLFRGVRVGKNAKLKNCVIMQGVEIGTEAVLENVITDKNVQVGAGQKLRGAGSFPVFIAKGCRVM